MDIGQSNLSVLKGNITSTDIRIETQKDITQRNIKQTIQTATKRGIDIVVSLIGITLLLPITFFVAICNIVKGENGPLIFKQERLGKNGKLFKMYKYRTMVVGAEDILKYHINNETDIGKEYIENKKIKDDPRVTKIGNFLRKTSLDEFPQFINVLKGEMSLVGPRPYLPIEKEDMGENYKYIMQMKPGLTGPWQVAGRSEIGFKERIELDKEFSQKESLLTDIHMILKTIIIALKRKGAM